MSNDIPKHVAIIMDGNGRWALGQKMSRVQGHKAGFDATKNIVDVAVKSKIEVLSLFAFSTENWRRPRFEVDALMALFSRAIDEELDELHQKAVRVRFIGEVSKLSKSLQKKFQYAQELTRKNAGMTLQLAVSYGGRMELTASCRSIAEKCVQGEMNPDDISEETLSAHMYSSDLPDPDLFIRTSGEMRLSNFFLWQLAYTELYFADVYWPDFGKTHFDEALASFAKRNRRFGKEKSCSS